jgi:hypothetical protein
MTNKTPDESVLHWRLARAGLQAPPAPSSSRLIELLRPWWEVWPEKLASFCDQLAQMRVTIGHAAVSTYSGSVTVPVPTVFVDDRGQTGTVANIVYFSLRDQTLRLRFQVETTATDAESDLELTLISVADSRPLVSALASPVAVAEYRFEVELPSELVEQWASLKGSDRMPFALILFAKSNRWKDGPEVTDDELN